MNSHTRTHLIAVAQLGPDEMMQLSAKVYSEFNQPFSILKVSGLGKIKTVQIKLRTGIKKTFTVGG